MTVDRCVMSTASTHHRWLPHRCKRLKVESAQFIAFVSSQTYIGVHRLLQLDKHFQHFNFNLLLIFFIRTVGETSVSAFKMLVFVTFVKTYFFVEEIVDEVQWCFTGPIKTIKVMRCLLLCVWHPVTRWQQLSSCTWRRQKLRFYQTLRTSSFLPWASV